MVNVKGRVYTFEQKKMSFLESSANSTSKSAPAKEFKEPKYTQPKRERSSVLQPSKNKWSVDLRRKEDVTTPSAKGKVNTTNSSNNIANDKSCTFSHDIFYDGKDELKSINDNDKPILKLWASKSKQNLNNRRNSGTKLPTGGAENLSLTNGSCSNEKDNNSAAKHVKLKAKYVPSPTSTTLNKNNLTDEKQNHDEEVKNYSKYGRSKNTYVRNGDSTTTGIDDIPAKPKTAKNNGEYTEFSKADVENSCRRENSPEVVNEGDRYGVYESELTEKHTKAKGNHHKRKKSKSILEYTHLNFLKSKKNCKNVNENNYSHKGLVIENGIVDYNTTLNGNRENQDTHHIDSNNKDDLESGCVNIINPTSARREIESNGSQNIAEIINTDPHSSILNGLTYQKAIPNGNLLCEPVSSNSFNIRARPSFVKKDKKDEIEKPCQQKLFVKSCDINLNSDSDNDAGDLENLRHATQSLLDNLNWDPTELSRNLDNYSLDTVNTVHRNGHREEEKVANYCYSNFEKTLNDKNTENLLNEEVINNNNTTEEMSNRAYISRSNTSSHYDDKTDTHKRLIRTSVTQIEKPILHSRRLSDTQVSNSIRRKYSTDSERVSRSRYDTYGSGNYSSSSSTSSCSDIGKRPYLRSQTQIRSDLQNNRPYSSFDPKDKTDNNKVETSIIEADDFKSSFLRQRLKEIDRTQKSHYSSETARKYSLEDSKARDDKVDAFIKSYKERRKSESLQQQRSQTNDSLLKLNCDKSNFNKFADLQQKDTNNVCVKTEEQRKNSLTSRVFSSSGNGSLVGGDAELECQQGRANNNMNVQVHHKFSRDHISHTHTDKSELIKQLPEKNRYSYPSRCNSGSESSGRSNKSISPNSSTHSIDSAVVNDSNVSTMTNNSKSSVLTLPAFGSITKVQTSRLSDVKELQSTFSSRRREKLRKTNSNNDDDAHIVDKCIVEENTNMECKKVQQTCPSHLECTNSGPKSQSSMERKTSGIKNPTPDDRHGSFPFFSHAKRDSLEKTPSTKSSYFSFIKDKIKIKKDGSITDNSPPVSPSGHPIVENALSVELGKENNDINSESFDGVPNIPHSPLPFEGRPRKGSKLKRLFQTKSFDRQSSYDSDNDKKNKKLSDKEILKKTDSSNEPTRIKTKLKYIDADVKSNRSVIEDVTVPPSTTIPVSTDSDVSNKKSSARVLSISTKSVKKVSTENSNDISVSKEVEIPDKISSVDVNSTTNEVNDFKVMVKSDRRSKRRDRRNLGLNTNDIDSVLATTQKENEVNSTDSVHLNLSLNSNDIDTPVDITHKEKEVSSVDVVVAMETNLTESLLLNPSSNNCDVLHENDMNGDIIQSEQSQSLHHLALSSSDTLHKNSVNNDKLQTESLFLPTSSNRDILLESDKRNSDVLETGSLLHTTSSNNEYKNININTFTSKDDTMFDISTPENDTFYLCPDRDDGSSEYHSDTSTKGFSSNKERIKNRKAARLEAAERRRQLNMESDGDLTLVVPPNKSICSSTDSIDVSNTGGDRRSSEGSVSVDKPSPPEVSPKKRKKHKAKRSNTEFITLPRNESIELELKTPTSQDDGIVMKRNNKRGNRTRTLDSGIDADIIASARKMANDAESQSGVVQETLSFADIKKKLLEGVTKTEEKVEEKEKEKVSAKNRQKIKRTKSTKRYKTITEGIAPRDLALAAQQAKESSNPSGKTIDKETLEQITASLSLASDNRKSFRVEGRPSSMHQSTENLRLSDGDIVMKDDCTPKPPTLHRTKSMTTLHFDMDAAKDKDDDDDEPEIKPLSEVRNRFLQAMEETNRKHTEKKTPIDIKRKSTRGDRANRPHTICGLDDWTMDKLMDDIGATPDSDLHWENKENIRKLSDTSSKPAIINRRMSGEKSKGDKLCDDILSLVNVEGISDSELDALLLDDHQPSKEDEKKEKESTTKEEVKVEEATPEPEVDLSQLSDLDFIAHQSTQLTSTHVRAKRNVRPQRRNRSGHNPIKSLQQREDLIDESDITLKDAEKAAKSLHPVVDAYRGLNAVGKGNPADRMLKRTDLAEEAVNALRATVDFSKTKLKKVVVAPGAVGVVEESFKPTEVSNVLIQVKGRRKVQTSIVSFSVDSLNANDCFIVLTPKDLLCWYGAQSNVIERAKAAEVASRLFQKKEMGCKAFDVLYVEQSGEVEKKIVRVLGGDASTKVDSRKSAINDEDFEKTLSSVYMTYIVCERNDPPDLIPLDSQCHRMPSKEILQTDSAFVFDFLHEVYVWLGRKTNSAQRGLIQKLAAEKFNEGYHKLSMERHIVAHGKTRAISTLKPETGPHLSRRASTQAKRRGSLKASSRAAPDQSRYQMQEKVPRPEHSILCQLFEGSEWVIFKEKFCDWPDESRIIRMKGGPESCGEVMKEVSTEIVISAVDAKVMVKPFVQPKMVLEQIDIGRGRGIPKGMDGYHIVTIDLKTWHVCENNAILMPDESFGQFHSGEGYVIRWLYKIIKVRNLRSNTDIAKAGGMERCCYFFWLGNDCSVNEEGATAVMTIELDKEKGPQIRVVLGKEPTALLNVFDGGMVIHAGKRPALDIRSRYSDESLVRLYCIRNEIPLEACLLQVPPYCESLRSRSSFVLLICQQGEVLLWHGCRSNEGTRTTAEHAAKQLMANHPEEASIAHITELHLTVIEEGKEPDGFWTLLDGKEDYGSLIDDPSDTTELTPRLFQLESTTGTFVAHEIVSPSKTDVHNCPFPVLQDDLYNVDQPAIFLLDAITHVYVWFGWWPDDIDVEASNSRRRRWDEERRKAMESAVAYAEELERPLHKLYAIYAGLEPESFIEMFPYWVVQDDITDLQIDEGIEEEKLYKITEELAIFTKEFYTITELRSSITPQGVDPTKLEKYLSEEDFLFLFGFSKEAFYTLPGWQQVNWKKKLGLY